MGDPIEFMITRSNDQISSTELKGRLETAQGWDPSIQLQILDSDLDTRPVDGTFISAIAAGSAAIGALFAALGGVVQSLGKQKIVIRFSDNTSVEVEGRNAEEIVRRVLPLLASKTDKKIVVTV